MKTPTHVSGPRHFLGMANQLGKFSPNLANLTRPLRELLAKRSIWRWDEAQATAFKEVKRELTAATTLTFYDPSADASAYGLGAVLLQKCKDGWKLVAYALRSLSETEQRYAQIEKEALAITWACEKFQTYLIGKRFQVETGHKPLVPLLSSTPSHHEYYDSVFVSTDLTSRFNTLQANTCTQLTRYRVLHSSPLMTTRKHTT